jgi:hypothetical protein
MTIVHTLKHPNRDFLLALFLSLHFSKLKIATKKTSPTVPFRLFDQKKIFVFVHFFLDS